MGEARAALRDWLWQLSVVARELAFCTYLFLVCSVPVVLDLLRGLVFGHALPRSVHELLDAEKYRKVVGGDVVKVEALRRLQTMANSTDRAWLEVTFGSGEKQRVFAKTCAPNSLIAFFFCVFDVYRNEVHFYQEVAPRVPVRTPRVLCARHAASRFVLVVEDVRPQQGLDDVRRFGGVKGGFPNIFMDPPCTRELAEAVLATYAKIHAKFLNQVPAGVWDDAKRPYFGKTLCLLAWHRVTRYLCPGCVSPAVEAGFKRALWHWDALRARYSAARPQTLIHGDAHLGNMFLLDKTPTLGLFDFQVVGSEHPMRDVTYFLCGCYPTEALAKDEHHLLAHYRAELQKHATQAVPSEAELWEEYRLQAFYAMYAYVFSGGLNTDLQDVGQTLILVQRTAAVMERCDSFGALEKVLRRD